MKCNTSDWNVYIYCEKVSATNLVFCSTKFAIRNIVSVEVEEVWIFFFFYNFLENKFCLVIGNFYIHLEVYIFWFGILFNYSCTSGCINIFPWINKPGFQPATFYGFSIVTRYSGVPWCFLPRVSLPNVDVSSLYFLLHNRPPYPLEQSLLRRNKIIV